MEFIKNQEELLRSDIQRVSVELDRIGLSAYRQNLESFYFSSFLSFLCQKQITCRFIHLEKYEDSDEWSCLQLKDNTIAFRFLRSQELTEDIKISLSSDKLKKIGGGLVKGFSLIKPSLQRKFSLEFDGINIGDMFLAGHIGLLQNLEPEIIEEEPLNNNGLLFIEKIKCTNICESRGVFNLNISLDYENLNGPFRVGDEISIVNAGSLVSTISTKTFPLSISIEKSSLLQGIKMNLTKSEFLTKSTCKAFIQLGEIELSMDEILRFNRGVEISLSADEGVLGDIVIGGVSIAKVKVVIKDNVILAKITEIYSN